MKLFTSIIKEVNSVAVERPTQVAICHGDSVITYRELEVRAASLSHALREEGVVRSSVVGLYVAQSIDFVIGALGIIRCGAAYVPLDPALPARALTL